jgi:hypothetical protein
MNYTKIEIMQYEQSFACFFGIILATKAPIL